MIIKYFAWLKTITNIEEEVLTDSSIKDINSLKKYLFKKYPKMKKHIEKRRKEDPDYDYFYSKFSKL